MILCIVGGKFGFFHSGFFMVYITLLCGRVCAKTLLFAIKRVEPVFLFGVRRGLDLTSGSCGTVTKQGGGYRARSSKGVDNNCKKGQIFRVADA